MLQFGVPLYGASMLSEVVRSTENSLACEPFQNRISQQPNGLPQVLLAERGGKQQSHPLIEQSCCQSSSSI